MTQTDRSIEIERSSRNQSHAVRRSLSVQPVSFHVNEPHIYCCSIIDAHPCHDLTYRLLLQQWLKLLIKRQLAAGNIETMKKRSASGLNDAVNDTRATCVKKGGGNISLTERVWFQQPTGKRKTVHQRSTSETKSKGVSINNYTSLMWWWRQPVASKSIVFIHRAHHL